VTARVVRITDCSTGIGRAVAERLTASGRTVVATDRAMKSVEGLPPRPSWLWVPPTPAPSKPPSPRPCSGTVISTSWSTTPGMPSVERSRKFRKPRCLQRKSAEGTTTGHNDRWAGTQRRRRARDPATGRRRSCLVTSAQPPRVPAVSQSGRWSTMEYDRTSRRTCRSMWKNRRS